MMRHVAGVAAGVAVLVVSLAAQQPPAPAGGRAGAQGPGGRGGVPGGRGAVAPPTARASSPVDLTGYWVAVVTEDWEWRMVTPKKGDYASVPLSAEGRKVADQWDVAQDGRCEAYGAAGLMRMPLRLHITWQDDNTLKIESDAGQQTRLLHFGAAPPAPGARTLQGHSVAEWDRGGAGFGRGFGGQGAGGGGGGRGGRGGAGGWAPLEVTTTNLAQGWLRRNGVPYSEQTRVTEHFIRFPEGKDEWMTVVQQIEDPRYLSQTFYVSSNFKREADGSRFKPSPCRAG